jgi:hypothetical protein
MTVESHGRTTEWLRDPIITSIYIEPPGPQGHRDADHRQREDADSEDTRRSGQIAAKNPWTSR